MLDPTLSGPLLRYLNSFAAYRLGNECDGFIRTLRENETTRLHYGKNPGGTRQFSSQMRDRWRAVAPE
jgi:hypothetical protein